MKNSSTRANRSSGLRALCLAATAVAAMLLCRQGAGATPDDGKASPATGVAAAWPTYRGNNARTGSARQTLGTPLFLQWTHVSAHRPRPAWPEPGKEVQRMTFDYAYQPVAAGRRLFYGSSADHQIHAVDLESGKELWRFFTEGPVRFAPCAAAGRVFAASDDGCLYCLDAGSGKLLWHFRGGPRDERMIGNEQMISRWPGRSGALVAGGTVYFTAGMWGPDGVYVYALDAEDGSVLWKNDTANFRYMPLPHNNYEGITGVAPQGYLALDEGVLVVPTGRSSPARFDADTGKWLSWKIDWGKNYRPGSAWTMTCRGVFFTACRHQMGLPESSLGPNSKLHSEGLLAFDLHTGRPVFGVGTAGAAAFDNGVLYLAADSYSGKYPAGVRAVDYGRIPKQRRLPQPNIASHDAAGVSQGTGGAEKWTAPAAHVVELVKAGRAVVAGGYNKVFVLDAETGRRLWETGVDGQARGLAVASGRLLVSTTTGKIYCFGEKKVAAPPVVRAVVEEDRKRKAESGERRAENGERKAESGE